MEPWKIWKRINESNCGDHQANEFLNPLESASTL